jgi:uncharacterized RDD family membrane protein YckC
MAEEVLTNHVDTDKLDKIIEVEPKVIMAEGVPQNEPEVEYEYVGFLYRFGARIIDTIIYFILFLALLFLIVDPIITSQANFTPEEFQNYQGVYLDRVTDYVDNSNTQSDELLGQTIKGFDCNELFKNESDNAALCEKVNRVNYITIVSISVIAFILGIIYFILPSFTKWQGTIGKKLLKLKIVNVRMRKISILQAFARESFWLISGLITILLVIYPGTFFANLYLISLILIVSDSLKVLFSNKKQTIHDNIADTYVVKTKEEF